MDRMRRDELGMKRSDRMRRDELGMKRSDRMRKYDRVHSNISMGTTLFPYE